MKQRAWLSLGSNVDRHRHLCAGLDALASAFGTLQVSSVYESAAVGFEGPAFLNLAVAFDSEMETAKIAETLRDIEDRHGRDRTQPRFSNRTLDIDLLMHGRNLGEFAGITLPRRDISAQAFVVAPLAELAPDLEIPGTGKTCEQLSQACKNADLCRVSFLWNGNEISSLPG